MQYLIVIMAAAAGAGIGYLVLRAWDNTRLAGYKNRMITMLEETHEAAERTKKERMAEAKEEILRLRQDAERDIKERRNELQRAERKIEQKEENLDRKLDKVSHKEDELRSRQEALEQRGTELETLIQQQNSKLEEIACLTREQAQEILPAP